MYAVIIGKFSVSQIFLHRINCFSGIPKICPADIDDVDLRHFIIVFPFLQTFAVDHGCVKPRSSGMIHGVCTLDFDVIQLSVCVLRVYVQNGIMGNHA